jgi:hypothetical protein
MLAVTFFEIIPKTILIWQKKEPTDDNLYLPMLLLLAGYLLTQFFEHTIAHTFIWVKRSMPRVRSRRRLRIRVSVDS